MAEEDHEEANWRRRLTAKERQRYIHTRILVVMPIKNVLSILYWTGFLGQSKPMQRGKQTEQGEVGVADKP